MVSFYTKLQHTQNQESTLPIVAKLQGIFDSIDDEQLLSALKGKIHRGCQGYIVKALWHSYLAAYILNIPTVRGLIRALESNHDLCKVVGISPLAIPHESTYSRFVAKVSNHNELVKATIGRAVAELKANLDDFGKVIAIDSTDVKAYSKGAKNSDTNRPADPDARWGAKKKHGSQYFWFGYKIHIVSDADYELPMNVEVSPADQSDYQSFIEPLTNANIKGTVEVVTADAGYDAVYNYGFVVDELGAIPLIDLNERGKKIANTERLHKRSKAELKLLDLRLNPGIARNSDLWKYLYSKRTSIERLFSRMKEFRRLGSVHNRGIEKVTLHAYLSTLTIVASAVDALYSEQPLRNVA